jgi:hypothetical protein
MWRGSKTSIQLKGETYFGVDITLDGRLVVAERASGRPVAVSRFPAGEHGARALREHIEHEHAHPHVCIKACGAAALGLATALMPVPGIGVALVTSQAIQDSAAKAASPEERAVRLARLSERLF